MYLMKKPVNSKLNADQIDFLENKIVSYVLELRENQYYSESFKTGTKLQNSLLNPTSFPEKYTQNITLVNSNVIIFYVYYAKIYVH